MLEARIASPDSAVAQARATFADDNDHSNNAILSRQVTTDPSPTAAQKAAGSYDKRKVSWRGMTIAIENEVGSTRSGTNRDGQTWTQKMPFAYGEIHQTEGVDGDCVDCFIGPDEDAQYVYIVHARKVNRWDEYDEDKVMLNFSTEEEAAAAFLACYSDPRFLGPITPMLVSEFIQKAQNTRNNPSMIKAEVFRALFMKAGSAPAENQEKITRDAFLYFPPHPNSPEDEAAQCITCRKFVPNSYTKGTVDLCIEHGSKVKVGEQWSCGLYSNWPKGPPNPEVIRDHAKELSKGIPGSVTPEQSGLVDRQVRCQNCFFYETKCNLYLMLNKALPEYFDLDANVNRYGCCNANTAIP
jgi:hypothetical protein